MRNLLVVGILSASALLNGCATSPDEIMIAGKSYHKDADGIVHLSKGELNQISGDGQTEFVEAELPAAKITEEEYALVEKNGEAFFSLVGEASPDDDVTMLVKPGSLKANLERLVKENHWEALYYDAADLYIPEPSILNAANVPMATMSLIQNYDLYPCIDEDNKVVTIIKN